ncbi:MAG: tetratricopeptide repeat protein [Desulfobacterales bacterium]|nr:tetratricopeptide repeat protein [Desulfobacterales bacterium]
MRDINTNHLDFLFNLFILVSVLLIYANTIVSPFIFDDWEYIGDNPSIYMKEFSFSYIKNAFSSHRPVAQFTFALNYYFHQYQLIGYHLTNMIIHVLVAICLYWLIKSILFFDPLMKSQHTSYRSVIAFFSTALWAFHPVQLYSVTYLVQRMNSLAALFYLLSMLCYIKARNISVTHTKISLFIIMLLFSMLALGCKPNAIILPLMIFCYEWYFYQDLNFKAMKVQLWSLIIIFAIICIMIFYILLADQISILFLKHQGNFFHILYQRSLTELRIFIFYLSVLIYPHPSRLNLDYDLLESSSLFNPPSTSFSLIATLFFIFLIVYWAKKKNYLSFALLWMILNLLIESLHPELELMYLHRLYIPSMLFFLAIVSLIVNISANFPLKLTLLGAIALYFSFCTHWANNIWKDELTLWTDCVTKSPNKARPYNNLANALSRREKLNEAICHYQKAIELDPNLALYHNNLAVAYGKQGKIDQAMLHLKETIRLAPDCAPAYNNIGLILMNQGKVKEAIWHFKKALSIDWQYSDAHNSLGVALAEEGRDSEAIFHFQTSLLMSPQNPTALYNLKKINQK